MASEYFKATFNNSNPNQESIQGASLSNIKYTDGLAYDYPSNTMSLHIADEVKKKVNLAISSDAVYKKLQEYLTKEDSDAIVTSLTDELNKKVDEVFLTSNYYTKTKIDEKLYDEANLVNQLVASKVDKVTGKGLSTFDFNGTYKSAIDLLPYEFSQKVDKEQGKMLTSNDFSNYYVKKLDDIEAGAQVNSIEHVLLNGVEVLAEDRTIALTVITSLVDDLVNYYKKSETYTKEEIQELLRQFTGSLAFEVVDTLPEENISTTTIYLVPRDKSEENNIYIEYLYINGKFEIIGSTTVDLTNYVTKTNLETILTDYVTNQSLTQTLTAYVTSQTFQNKLNETLEDYVTNDDFNQYSAGITEAFTNVETNLDTKVDKVEGKGLSANDYDDTAKGIVDSTTENLSKKVSYSYLDKVGTKNLILLTRENGYEYSANGVTIVKNNDGTFHVSGTATDYFSIPISKNRLPVGSYTVSGCPEGGTYDTYYLYSMSSENPTGLNVFDYGEGGLLNVKDTETQTILRIVVKTGATVDLTFKPMIRLSSNTDSTYEPYSKTNQELTNDLSTLENSTEAVLATKVDVDDMTEALATKVDKVGGKGLSTNDYTNAEKEKVQTIDSKLNTVTYSSGTFNLDDIKETGIYYFTNGCTLINTPNSGTTGWLIVLFSGGSAVKQFWTRHGTLPITYHDTYYRFKPAGENTTFSDWSRMISDYDIKYLGYVGAKNLIEPRLYPGYSEVVAGITCTMNLDGSISAKGTVTSSAQNITIGYFTAKDNEKYILSGSIDSKAYIALNSGSTWIYNRTENEGEFTAIKGTKYLVKITFLDNGRTIDGTFYPMVRYKTDTDTTYQPYAPTNFQIGERMKAKEWGVRVDYSTGRITRLGDGIGANFDNATPWMRRRCDLSTSGTINSYYGYSNYTETSNNAMVEQPKFYVKAFTISSDIKEYWISDYPLDGYILCPGFHNNSGDPVDYIYLSAYEGSLYDQSTSTYVSDDSQVADFDADTLVSRINMKPISGYSQNLTRANARKLANNKGNGWQLPTIFTLGITQLLFLIEYASFNSQQIIGRGVVDLASGSANQSVNTGATSSLGNKTGMASGTNGQVSISYRGEENIYGNIWTWVDGINCNSTTTYVKEYGTMTDDTATGYTQVGFNRTGAANYISNFGVDTVYPNIFLPLSTSGNENTPVGDYYWYNSGWRVVRSGGRWNDGSDAGLFYLTCTSASSGRSRGIGGRLLYVPQ